MLSAQEVSIAVNRTVSAQHFTETVKDARAAEAKESSPQRRDNPNMDFFRNKATRWKPVK